MHDNEKMDVSLGILDGNIGIIEFQAPSPIYHFLGRHFLHGLHEKLLAVTNNQTLRGLLITSKTLDCFSAGYDIPELLDLKKESDGLQEYHQFANRVLELLESLQMPTIALVDGICKGPGAELILACDYRLSSKSPSTTFTFHDIQKGVPPSWGATYRLPRLIGFHKTLEMILSSTSINPDEALSMGLVDCVCDGEMMIGHAADLIISNRQTPLWKNRRSLRTSPTRTSRAEMELTMIHFRKYLEKLEISSRSCWKLLEINESQNPQEWVSKDRETFLKAWDSEVCSNLLQHSIWEKELKREPALPPGENAPLSAESAAIIGSGMIGPRIASIFTAEKIHTILIDQAPFQLHEGTFAIINELERLLRGKFMDVENALASVSRLSTSTVLSAVQDRNFILEAVVENVETKAKLLRDISLIAPAGTIIASNTATISISELARELKHPENFAGFHFIPPVDSTKIIEIIRSEKTSDWTVASLIRLARRIRKIPIVVKDYPGFLINRLMLPLILESSRMVLEGCSPYLIDECMQRAGFSWGVFQFMDIMGIGNVYFSSKNLTERLGKPFNSLSLQKILIDAGRLGKKVNLGFYKHTDKGTCHQDPNLLKLLSAQLTSPKSFASSEIIEQLMLSTLVEAYRVLQDKIVHHKEIIDFSLVQGIGFPRRVGGVFHWAISLGKIKVEEMLQKYAHLGESFTPGELMRNELQDGFQGIHTNLILF
ncbi:MAG: 3-hydroxyacyl-CoA dehydrogenase NAD-binding domain-containing protein [Gemmataceae bacterium]